MYLSTHDIPFVVFTVRHTCESQRVAACCNVLQRVVVRCSALQCIAVRFSATQCLVGLRSALLCRLYRARLCVVAVCCRLHGGIVYRIRYTHLCVVASELHRFAERYIYIHVYIFIHIYVYICVYTYAYMCICVYLHTHTCI